MHCDRIESGRSAPSPEPLFRRTDFRDNGMQKVVFDEPYEFVPPYRGRFWSWAVGKMLPWLLRRRYGVVSWKTEGLDHLRASLTAGYGIILCPNHCSFTDPMMGGVITTETPCHAFALASWHVFKQNRFETWIARRIGGFSIYREGMDRKALDAAIEIVSTAERPLFVFPEGVISGANDRLMALMDGVSFIAGAAARKRAKKNPDSKVVIHPVAYRYEHQTKAEDSLTPVVEQLETLVFWRTQPHLSLRDRILRVREAVLSRREVQILGSAAVGDVEDRIANLVNHILQTYEKEWLGGAKTGDVISRVKDLRIEIIADMAAGKVDSQERARRWQHLTDLYYAQCMSLHVKGYLDIQKAGDRLNHRLFETAARLEEELTDQSTVINDMHARVCIGKAIEIDPKQRRSREGDPLITRLRTEMLQLMGVDDEWPPQPVRNV